MGKWEKQFLVPADQKLLQTNITKGDGVFSGKDYTWQKIYLAFIETEQKGIRVLGIY